MTLVVDTNVLMSALIADSTTRTLLRTIDDRIVAPEKLRTELEGYDDLLWEKSGLSDSELDVLKNRLFDHVALVPDGELRPYRDEAVDALADVDPDDVIFLATALAVEGTIWSDDKDFQKQDLVPVVTTGEVIEGLPTATEE